MTRVLRQPSLPCISIAPSDGCSDIWSIRPLMFSWKFNLVAGEKRTTSILRAQSARRAMQPRNTFNAARKLLRRLRPPSWGQILSSYQRNPSRPRDKALPPGDKGASSAVCRGRWRTAKHRGQRPARRPELEAAGYRGREVAMWLWSLEGRVLLNTGARSRGERVMDGGDGGRCRAGPVPRWRWIEAGTRRNAPGRPSRRQSDPTDNRPPAECSMAAGPANRRRPTAGRRHVPSGFTVSPSSMHCISSRVILRVILCDCSSITSSTTVQQHCIVTCSIAAYTHSRAIQYNTNIYNTHAQCLSVGKIGHAGSQCCWWHMALQGLKAAEK